MESAPRAYIDALSQELQTDVETWEVATFSMAHLHSSPTTVYRRDYFLRFRGATPTPLTERDIQDPLEAPVVTSLKDAEGKTVESMTADEQLPSPLLLSERLRQILARGREEGVNQDILVRLGDPRVLAKWLGCYYLAMERGLFDEKERAAVTYLQSVVRDYYMENNVQKAV